VNAEVNMTKRVLAVAVLALAAGAAPAAEPIPPGFRAAFEYRIHRGSYAVVTQNGIPTTPVHGADGKQAEAYFSIDVKNGGWKPSGGFMDVNQVQTGALALGELMEVVDVTFKDGARIDLRLVSLESHEVVRPKGGPGREPVSTNFKFFFPFPLTSGRDVAEAMDYVEEYLQVFRREDEARAYAERMVPGAARPGAGAPAGMVRAEIKTGMTPLEVLDALGKPQAEVAAGGRSKWTYPNLTVIFENGRVKEVQF
jgi:hypothetical protein